MGTRVITEYKYIDNKGYDILDNKMDKRMTHDVIDVASSAFFQKKYILDRCEYIKNRLDEIYPDISWSVFIYSDGYCNVSYDNGLYICGKANDYYIIIFGHHKSNSK